ncbi:MAG: hypothetical protein JRJ59_05520 [Deltaproteobacteria bacterium]|nr:hypothetical protein [Deltaproteobacteria bacterium]
MPRGITIIEQATNLMPTREVKAGFLVAVGLAPVHTSTGGHAGTVNVPLKFLSRTEFATTLGWSDDFATFDLCEVADAWFSKYANHPLCVINVFDPETHKTDVTSEEQTFADDIITLDHGYVLAGEQVKDSTETTTYEEGTDYTIDRPTGIITRIPEGGIGETETVKVTYSYSDASQVVSDDIIGEVDPETGAATGLELINEVFPRFGLIPGQIIAPAFSTTPAVAIAMAAKANSINGMFKALTWCDLPTSVDVYTEAGTPPAWPPKPSGSTAKCPTNPRPTSRC